MEFSDISDCNEMTIRQRAQAMREILQGAIKKHNKENKNVSIPLEIDAEKKEYLAFKKIHWVCDCSTHPILSEWELKKEQRSLEQAQNALLLARKMREGEIKREQEKYKF